MERWNMKNVKRDKFLSIVGVLVGVVFLIYAFIGLFVIKGNWPVLSIVLLITSTFAIISSLRALNVILKREALEKTDSRNKGD